MKRLGPGYLWLVSLAVPAAMVATSACSGSAAAPNGNGGSSTTGMGGAVSGTTGGSGVGTGTGGAASSFGGNNTTTTGGAGTTTTGGAGTTTTGGAGTTTTGGASSAGSTSTAGTTSATGGASTVGGSTAGGTGGAAPKVKLCATKTTLTIPLMTNFDSYDGKTAADAWSFPFNGTAADPGVPYAGPYTFNDMTGTPFIGMVGGASASTYAISISNPMATGWGGALAFWMGCANASAYAGVQFNARGTIPTGMVSVSLTMEQTSAPDPIDANGGGTCDAGAMCKSPQAAVAVTADWQLIKIPWSMFAPGVGSAMAAVAPTGDNLAGFSFSVGLVYMESPAGSMMYVATPAAYDFQLDDLGFY